MKEIVINDRINQVPDAIWTRFVKLFGNDEEGFAFLLAKDMGHKRFIENPVYSESEFANMMNKLEKDFKAFSNIKKKINKLTAKLSDNTLHPFAKPR